MFVYACMCVELCSATYDYSWLCMCVFIYVCNYVRKLAYTGELVTPKIQMNEFNSHNGRSAKFDNHNKYNNYRSFACIVMYLCIVVYVYVYIVMHASMCAKLCMSVHRFVCMYILICV